MPLSLCKFETNEYSTAPNFDWRGDVIEKSLVWRRYVSVEWFNIMDGISLNKTL